MALYVAGEEIAVDQELAHWGLALLVGQLRHHSAERGLHRQGVRLQDVVDRSKVVTVVRLKFSLHH